MYSYKDRLQGVQLYVNLGKRIGLTVRHLGYPTQDALKTWCREYEPSHELPAGCRRLASFSQAQKERAVEHFREHGGPSRRPSRRRAIPAGLWPTRACRY